jgi:polyhydroxyalkanoate synthesis regulator phasin
MPAMNAAGALMPSMPSVETLPQAFRELGTQWLDATPRALGASFDRTFGALYDALGFGPVRKLQAAGRDLVAASFAQNEARGNYLLLVQRAFAIGFDRLMHRLAEMADNGERIDSVLALMRMWAVQTEEAVHEVLQSEEGLVATANVTRAGLAYRRKIQHVAMILADSLDMATQSDLDEAYREIQELKREVRALRAVVTPAKRAARAPQPQAKGAVR